MTKAATAPNPETAPAATGPTLEGLGSELDELRGRVAQLEGFIARMQAAMTAAGYAAHLEPAPETPADTSGV